jgi:hypothetical protein
VTGPENYEAAQNILASALKIGAGVPREDVRAVVEMAQAHAILALAAATAMAGINHMDEDDFREWDRVAGVQPDVAES